MTGFLAESMIVVAVGVVVFSGDHVLLIQRRNPPQRGAWTLPGGRQHSGETLRETAVREVQEETGVVITLRSLVDTIDLIERDNAGHVTRHYVVADFWGEAVMTPPVANDDAQDARWVALDDLHGYNLTAEVRRMIDEALQQRETRPKAAGSSS